jgi:branched-chain amino acid transport system substrate-binding protein
MKRVIILLVLTFQIFYLQTVTAKEAALKIYLDADFSNHFESSLSIERGLRVALHNTDFQLLGRSVELVRKDHRGNSARSQRHIDQYLQDPDALLMVSGIHSPPLLAHREKINQEGVLFLVPWAAAGPITRYPSETNWIFRLSVDDSKAGQVISSFAVKEKNYRKPFLMLENTGWGKSNERTMSRALRGLGIDDFNIGWFDWNLKESGARSLINRALETDSDVIFLVANAIEGKVIVNTLASLAEDHQLPVVSHWGIIGGDFHKQVMHGKRQKVDLNFIQTRFSFINNVLDEYETNVLVKAQELYPEIVSTLDIQAPTGFIHAHDLGLLLVEASKQVAPDLSIVAMRENLRVALENIDNPVRGLIKTYQRPFSKFTELKPDAHEALAIKDFVMASFGAEDEIILHSWRFE